jgi:hypothetical protein
MTDTTDLVARLNAYFVSGGLFNPELANHTAVSELVRDSRDTIERLTRERDEARAVFDVKTAAQIIAALQEADLRSKDRIAKLNSGLTNAIDDVVEARLRIAKLEAALRALQLQALQSDVNSPHNEWGREALDAALSALEDKP